MSDWVLLWWQKPAFVAQVENKKRGKTQERVDISENETKTKGHGGPVKERRAQKKSHFITSTTRKRTKTKSKQSQKKRTAKKTKSKFRKWKTRRKNKQTQMGHTLPIKKRNAKKKSQEWATRNENDKIVPRVSIHERNVKQSSSQICAARNET